MGHASPPFTRADPKRNALNLSMVSLEFPGICGVDIITFVMLSNGLMLGYY